VEDNTKVDIEEII